MTELGVALLAECPGEVRVGLLDLHCSCCRLIPLAEQSGRLTYHVFVAVMIHDEMIIQEFVL